MYIDSDIILKILVTGASGFIGSRLAAKLAENGHIVTGLIHEHDINLSIQKHTVDLVNSNFSIPNETYDVVFHLAAVTPMEKDKNTIKKVNYDGTVNLFNHLKNRTKFIVYASGLGVFGEPSGIVDETTPLKPHTYYTQVRLEAQRFLEKNCKDNSIPLTVAYFGEVYGNGGWFVSQMIQRLQKGIFKLPKSGEYYRSFVHIDDVVSALVAIAEKNVVNETFIVTDSNPVLFKEFINYTCDELGIKHPGNIPTILAKAVMGGDFVKLLTTSIKTSNAKIARLIQFRYPTYKEGVKAVISQV
ncbi:MAG: NAD(P)-dependent oxidoreductase [Thaumarchaeota archaeon]|nr:NAD(P)-dependent oxidoreductase [Nitrososphaerota archaeon]